VAQIVDYPRVLEQLTGLGLVCNYHNSGAFGFPAARACHIVGWIGGEDSTIRPEMRRQARLIPPPYEPNLSRLALQAWQRLVPGEPAWLMPMSHWAYELQFGGAAWLPGLLESVGVDPALLRPRNDAAAIAFDPAEPGAFERFLAGLLLNLGDSDFMLAFARPGVLCMVHHHRQLWWMTGDEALALALREPGPAD
jgi:hypothetical protein